MTTNYCFNSYYFWGPTEAIEKLHSILEIGKCFCDIFEKSGYKDLIPKLSDRRHLILYVEPILDHVDDRFSEFELESESAWVPMPEDFDLLIKNSKEFEGIEYVFMAEEPNRGIFINTDKDRVYFDISYRIYWIDGEDGGYEDFYTSKEEAIDAIRSHYDGQIDIEISDSLIDIERKVDVFLENDTTGKYDNGINFNEYRDYEKQKAI